MAVTNTPIAVAAADEPLPIRQRSRIGRSFRQPAVAAGIVVLVVFALAALFAGVLSPSDPLTQNVVAGLRPPSTEHLLGTDKLGRDVFSRMLYGARISLLVGFGVVGIAAGIGSVLGLVAGYAGGLVDELLM